MKIKLFSISILAVAMSVTVVKAQLGSHIGFNVGPSFGTLYGNNGTDNLRGHTGFAAGLTYQYAFSTAFALHTGLLYESKGASQRTTIDPFDIDVRTNYNYNYLTIPVLFRAHLIPDKKLRPFINAGPYFAFLTRQMTVVRTENGDDYDVNRYNNTNDYKGFDIGLSAGVGIDYLITDMIHLDFEIRDNLGLFNISESSNDNARLKNNSLNFLIGMQFSIH
ncbi:MAG: PorT family protein [Sphingobacteriales bacterium JAD_PAG50586_3]|nr:MAG: PorT family protein [Sphingobacteriales bacterium JAD_PAG50586_3]